MWQHSYRGRKLKKRAWRRLWIVRIGAAVRQYGAWNYSRFIHAQQKVGITLNRKVLADLAVREPFALKSVIDTVTTLRRRQVGEDMEKEEAATDNQQEARTMTVVKE